MFASRGPYSPAGHQRVDQVLRSIRSILHTNTLAIYCVCCYPLDYLDFGWFWDIGEWAIVSHYSLHLAHVQPCRAQRDPTNRSDSFVLESMRSSTPGSPSRWQARHSVSDRLIWKRWRDPIMMQMMQSCHDIMFNPSIQLQVSKQNGSIKTFLPHPAWSGTRQGALGLSLGAYAGAPVQGVAVHCWFQGSMKW